MNRDVTIDKNYYDIKNQRLSVEHRPMSYQQHHIDGNILRSSTSNHLSLLLNDVDEEKYVAPSLWSMNLISIHSDKTRRERNTETRRKNIYILVYSVLEHKHSSFVFINYLNPCLNRRRNQIRSISLSLFLFLFCFFKLRCYFFMCIR